MANAAVQNPAFHDDDAAREALEAVRWPDGPVCPHCGNLDQDKIAKGQGTAHRAGLYYCAACNGQFTVTVGTVMERSKIPLSKWLFAMHLMAASKKGMSAHQMHRLLGITYKTAWFMCHRIREAMAPHASTEPLGGKGKVVEADEAFIGGKEKNKHRNKRVKNAKGMEGKEKVFSLVERGGKVRSHHVPDVSARSLRPILFGQLKGGTTLMTDEGASSRAAQPGFRRHQMVNHSIGEYVRGEAHTNTIESYFAIMKRGITGVYHHVSQQHLKRYLAEFDFRYNERQALGVDDTGRVEAAIKGIAGKRLTYRPPHRDNEPSPVR